MRELESHAVHDVAYKDKIASFESRVAWCMSRDMDGLESARECIGIVKQMEPGQDLQ